MFKRGVHDSISIRLVQQRLFTSPSLANSHTLTDRNIGQNNNMNESVTGNGYAKTTTTPLQKPLQKTRQKPPQKSADNNIVKCIECKNGLFFISKPLKLIHFLNDDSVSADSSEGDASTSLGNHTGNNREEREGNIKASAASNTNLNLKKRATPTLETDNGKLSLVYFKEFRSLSAGFITLTSKQILNKPMEATSTGIKSATSIGHSLEDDHDFPTSDGASVLFRPDYTMPLLERQAVHCSTCDNHVGTMFMESIHINKERVFF